MNEGLWSRYTNTIDRLVGGYHYKFMFPASVRSAALALYCEAVDALGLVMEGESDIPLIPLRGSEPIAIGYNRIVVGNYGAYIECTPEQMCMDSIMVAAFQEYRITDPKYLHNVKYHWYAPKEGCAKIYYQRRVVDYADYVVGMYYIPIYDVMKGERI